MKNQKLLTLINYPCYGGAVVYKNIYPAPYIPLYGSNKIHGGEYKCIKHDRNTISG